MNSAYNQLTYTALQTRLASSVGVWLDLASADFFGTTLPRLPNEQDDPFLARIKANLFVKGPTRGNMAQVLTLLTGRAPTIFEPGNVRDSQAWNHGAYWGAAGGWGSNLPFQSLVTVYRPNQALVSLGEWETWRMAWGAYGAWSSAPPNAITDAALIAAVESTRALGHLVWMRIADGPVTP